MTDKTYKMLAIGLIVLLGGGFYWVASRKTVTPTNPPTGAPTESPTATSTPSKLLAEPISHALDRVTKKPFGIKISPLTSPIQPERFSGYHTGVDFETFADEQTADVPIYALCAGPLILKKVATGYGGVAVQACTINQQAVTVVYGHLRLKSVDAKLNQVLSAGQQLGVLGTGFSQETDGERKHLHLGIHLGQAVNLLGYVQQPAQLNQWLDFSTLFK